MYTVRLARMEDLLRVEEIFSYARAFMASTGNPNQWGKTNPPTERLKADIAEQKLFVVTGEDGIHGVFYFSLGEDPTYAVIEDGAWGSDSPYGTIHRIAGDGSGGVFAAALAYCGSIAGHLRIDTHHDNKVMQHVLQKHGFRRRGIIHLPDGSPRIAYDRI